MTIGEIIQTGDREAWREFLNTCTMQEAWDAWLKASQSKGCEDMARLAWLRQEHLNGEHRHPELWA